MRNTLGKIFYRGPLPAASGFIASVVILSLLSTNAFARVVDGIAIIVNKDAILVSEINETMMPLIKEFRTKYAGAELKKKMDTLRDTVIQQAIENKLILQVAKERGITADENAVDSRLDVVVKRFPSEDDFLQALATQGLTYKEYRDQVAEQVLIQETLRRVLSTGINVTDNEIREYYDSHPEEFVTEPKVRLAQIFLNIPSEGGDEAIEEVRQKAEQLRVLIEDGMDFSELAKKYSEGPYRDSGGVIGVAGPKEILPELEDVAFSLKTGETSGVVQTTYGFHILKALEAFPSRKIGFEEAKPTIDERLQELKRSEKYSDWIKKLREESFIDIRI